MVQKRTRIAAIYDIHGNLPALQAVLAELESHKPDLFVVGEDVVAGPMPTEVMDRLVTLGERTCFARGNADREVVAAYDDGRYADPIDVADPAERVAAYAASRIDREQRDLLASFAERLIVEVQGVGQVLFCHGSPRSDEEIVTAATTEGRLREILSGVDQDLVVCGHTHAQFDRRVGAKRIVNAGSVGMPYQGKPVGAFWLLLGVGGVSLRRSDYDLDRTIRQIRATGYPDAEYMVEILLEHRVPPAGTLGTKLEARNGGDGHGDGLGGRRRRQVSHWAPVVGTSDEVLLSRRVEDDEADLLMLIDELLSLTRKAVWAVDHPG